MVDKKDKTEVRKELEEYRKPGVAYFSGEDKDIDLSEGEGLKHVKELPKNNNLTVNKRS